MNVKQQSWQDTLERYQNLPSDSEMRLSMLELVNYISESEFGKRLYPWMSMFELRITQTENHPFQDFHPFLLIKPRNDGSAEFRYVDSNISSKHWVRNADKGRLIERFESFLEQLCWKPKQLS